MRLADFTSAHICTAVLKSHIGQWPSLLLTGGSYLAAALSLVAASDTCADLISTEQDGTSVLNASCRLKLVVVHTWLAICLRTRMCMEVCNFSLTFRWGLTHDKAQDYTRLHFNLTFAKFEKADLTTQIRRAALYCTDLDTMPRLYICTYMHACIYLVHVYACLRLRAFGRPSALTLIIYTSEFNSWQ